MEIGLWFWTGVLGVALVIIDWALGVLFPKNKKLAAIGLKIGAFLIAVSLLGILYPLLIGEKKVSENQITDSTTWGDVKKILDRDVKNDALHNCPPFQSAQLIVGSGLAVQAFEKATWEAGCRPRTVRDKSSHSNEIPHKKTTFENNGVMSIGQNGGITAGRVVIGELPQSISDEQQKIAVDILRSLSGMSVKVFNNSGNRDSSAFAMKLNNVFLMAGLNSTESEGMVAIKETPTFISVWANPDVPEQHKFLGTFARAMNASKLVSGKMTLIKPDNENNFPTVMITP